MFYRQHTDGRREAVSLDSIFGGGFATPCWLMGGGPSLAALPIADIDRAPVPKFALNLAGSGLLRPDFWTSYDPTARFHRSIYLDPSVMKFLHHCRARDLVPETTMKVCESPATFFFDRDRERGFADFLGSASTGVVDWQDSLIQAIDIAWRLGFRKLYLAGTEMFIPPSAGLRQAAEERGVRYEPRELLKDFLQRCEQAGMKKAELEQLSTAEQYHFTERKPLAAAVQTDFHYFRVAQYLRLSRRSLALAGMELISVTPVSRLNDSFEYRDVAEVLEEIRIRIGDPARERTEGRYTNTPDRSPHGIGPMRDFSPHFWSKEKVSREAAAAQRKESAPASSDPRRRLRAALEGLPEVEVDLKE